MTEDLAWEAASAEALTVPLSYRPRKSADVLEIEMGDGLILYNHDGDLVHHLNPSAGILWHLCAGDVTVAQLGGEIAEEYGLESRTIQQQVATVIAEFDALGLVADSGSLGPREGSEAGMTVVEPNGSEAPT